ncbi:protein of unknown function [Methylacidimicrobium sp. AP8]|nr:protein of unknown function [Methylacidimicrobium sp. AP8]
MAKAGTSNLSLPAHVWGKVL